MKRKPKKDIADSRPKDKSLEAYKAWVNEIASRLITNARGIKLTEEDWILSWKEYWKEQTENRKE